MVMPSFYREQKTAKVLMWKNISDDSGKKLRITVQGETPYFREEIQYLNNMGFPVCTMNSTGVRVDHNSVNSTEIPKGFLIIFKYQVAAKGIDRFRNFIFNVPTETLNPVLREMVVDFNKFSIGQQRGISSYQRDYNFDFVMYVEAEELASVDTLYVPECNITLSSGDLLKMPSNPTLAMRYNQKPVRVYACEEFKENFKYSTTVQAVASDHIPDSYFYYIGKEIHQTEAVKRQGAEEGILIITHHFNDENQRFNISTKFLPIEEAVENGFFRTKQDLLTNGDPEEVAKRQMVEKRVELEKLKHKTETIKVTSEEQKVKIRGIELETELVKASSEFKRQDFESARHLDRREILMLETNLSKKKVLGDIARETLSNVTAVATAKLKIEQTIIQNNIENERSIRKLDVETQSMNINLDIAREKAKLDRDSITRKNTEEGIKVMQLAANVVKGFF